MYRLGPIRFAIIVALALLTLAAPVAAGQEATPAAADLRIVEQIPVANSGLRILGLSPDGRFLFGADREQVCAIAADAGLAQRCAPFRGSVDEEHVAFSPDGTRVAFAENAAQLLIDGDLWVFDLTAASLTNLTDDGYEGRLIGGDLPDDPFPIDSAPAWSPDGRTLAFARSEWDDGLDDGTALYRIAADGGEPARIAAVSSEPFAVYFGLHWLPEGERIAFVVANQDRSDPRNGLWLVDAATGATSPVQPTDPERGVAQLLAISPGNQALLFDAQRAARFDSGSGDPFFSLIDLENGSAQSFIPTTDLGPYAVTRVAFSPAGDRLLFIDATGEHLFVHDLATGEERDLFADLPVEERPGALAFRLVWAANDLVYVSATPFEGTLLELDAG